MKLKIKKIIEKLKQSKLTLSVADSCTGGLISKIITDFPGASKFFLYCVVSYNDESKKEILKVKEEVLKKYGAVSKEVASAMLEGVNKILNTDISISITGIAGPTGGTREKPIGTVYIGIKFKNEIKVHKFNFNGNRIVIRKKIAYMVFQLLWEKLKSI